jgi:serine/threonine protein kinase
MRGGELLADTRSGRRTRARLGGYEVLRALGAGGMGEVYLARDTTLDRMVVLKLLPADRTSNPHRVSRLEREARSASALNHANVCVIHALGTGMLESIDW